MKWFRGRGGRFSAIEAALRAQRPRPRAALERDIADRVGGKRAERGARPMLALVMTAGAGAGDFRITQGSSTQTCLVPPPPK